MDASDEMRPPESLAADPAELLPLADWERPVDLAARVRPAEEVIAASRPRAAHAPARPRKVMTQSHRAEDWRSAGQLLRLVDLGLQLHGDWFDATATRLSGALPGGLRTLDDLSAFWAARLVGPGVAPPSGLSAVAGGVDDEDLPDDEGSRHDLSMVAVAMTALTPTFLRSRGDGRVSRLM